MKGIKYLIGAAIIIVIIVVLLSLERDNADKVVKQDTQSEKESQIIQEVQKLCSKYNAVTDWRQNFDTNDLFQGIYTIQVEDALVRTDNRPIMFFAPVKDIVRETTKHSVHFHNPLDIFPEIYLVLDCTPEQIGQIMQHRADLYCNYAVVAQVSEVKKVRFEVKGYAETYEEVRLELEQSDIFIATGKCLELLPVGDYEP